MPGPARAGLFIYAKHLERLTAFYAAVLSMKVIHTTPQMVILQSTDMQIILHRIPGEISSTFEIAQPPAPREDAAYKFFFTVESLAHAESVATRQGGSVLPEQWQGPGFKVRNAVDPEGNIFQLRESQAPSAFESEGSTVDMGVRDTASTDRT